MPLASYFCLRFDVDTELCVRNGIPNLLDLAAANGARFTFFVTPGRAIARLASAASLLRRRPGKSGDSARMRLGTLDKLGAIELGRLLALNPRLLPRGNETIQSAFASGHEIGLHGGSNHALWQRGAHAWSKGRLERELDYGCTALESATGSMPISFASPGWNSPPALCELLADRGFRVLADEHGRPAAPHRIPGCGLVSAPTWLAGEPGGVGYLEWNRARGKATERIVAGIRRHLEDGPELVCLYDHPFFAGIRELTLLERILEAARASGREVLPLGTAAMDLTRSGPHGDQ